MIETTHFDPASMVSKAPSPTSALPTQLPTQAQITASNNTPAAPLTSGLAGFERSPNSMERIPVKSGKFTFNKEALNQHILAVRANLKQYVGQPGYNPFLINHKLTPLVTRLNEGEETEALHNSIMEFSTTINPVAKGAEHNINKPPKEAQAAGGNKPVIVSREHFVPGL